MYFNACSIAPKFGELCPIVETHHQLGLGSVKKFQIMRLVHIPGYNPFCRDRNGHNVRLIVLTIGHSSPNLGTMLQALKYIIGKECLYLWMTNLYQYAAGEY